MFVLKTLSLFLHAT